MGADTGFATGVGEPLEGVEQVRAGVGVDRHAWLLTDPETEVGTGPRADVPCLLELPRLIRLKYLTTVNRWTHAGPVTTLRAGPGDHRERSLVWRDLQRDCDVGDVAPLVFRDRFGCWGFLDLWRAGADAEFTERDAALLTAIRGTRAQAAPAFTFE